jgi:hypothetical protein
MVNYPYGSNDRCSLSFFEVEIPPEQYRLPLDPVWLVTSADDRFVFESVKRIADDEICNNLLTVNMVCPFNRDGIKIDGLRYESRDQKQHGFHFLTFAWPYPPIEAG